MKKTLLIKRFNALLLLLFAFWQFGLGQALLVENFDYTSGSLLTANGWTAHSGTTNAITVNSLGLSFTGFPGSGIGLSALLDNTGEDVSKGFSTVTSGNVYAAFLINVTSIANLYCLHLGGTPIATTFRGKVFINGSGTNYNIGLSKGSNTPTLTAGAPYTTGTTYLAVLKYTIVAGTSNDEVSIFIFDGSIPATEPVTPTIGPLTDGTMSDINPGTIALRQDVSAQNIVFDGIRIATSWTDAISDVYPPVGTYLPANSATDVAINVTPTITFDEAVRKTDGNSLENADLASLITFKKTNSGGTDVPFTATIDATKKVITVTPSSTLDNSQVYYLAVGPVEDASGNESTTSSASFTTIAAAAPTVTLTYPAGGETFYAGSPTTFTWTSANITNVKIEVWSPDNSRTYTWNPITASTPAAAGTFAFTVPSDLYYGTQYKIRISDASNAAVYSESGNFTCIPVVASLTDLKLRSIANDIIKVSGEVILTFKRTATNRNQKYIQDSGAGMLIDDAAAVLTTILTVGDKIKDFEGKLGTFNGMWQMVPTKSTVSVVSSGNSVTPVTLTIPEYVASSSQYESMLIKLPSVTFTDANGSATFAAETQYTLNDGTNDLALYTFDTDESNVVGSVIPSGNYSVTGIALKYNTTLEISPRAITDFEFLTGVEKLSSADQIKIYPVPASSVLNISNVKNLKSIEILDAAGIVVKTINTEAGELIQLPVNDLNKGIYMIRFNTGNVRTVKKFVKY